MLSIHTSVTWLFSSFFGKQFTWATLSSLIACQLLSFIFTFSLGSSDNFGASFQIQTKSRGQALSKFEKLPPSTTLSKPHTLSWSPWMSASSALWSPYFFLLYFWIFTILCLSLSSFLTLYLTLIQPMAFDAHCEVASTNHHGAHLLMFIVVQACMASIWVYHASPLWFELGYSLLLNL